jgi:hypothetical protein
MIRKLSQLLALALIALSGAFALTGPALAVPSCGSGYICFYDATDGSTLLAKVAASSYVRSFCYTNSSGKIPAGTSYIVNNPDASSFVVSTSSGCGPTTGPIYANSAGAMNGTFSNHIKGIYRA